MSEKLLPCPFCGGEAQLYKDPNDYQLQHHIECLKCSVASQSFDTSEEAIAAWNTRISPEREALEKIVAVYDDDSVKEERVAPEVYRIATAALGEKP